VKRLIGLAQLESNQLTELRESLRAAEVAFTETPPSLLSFGAIWVADDDLDRARDLLLQESATFAAQAREAWQREWREQHHRSYVRWLLARLRGNPAEIIAALLMLAFFGWLLVIYPLLYLVRRLS
jgi:hypothetical protein